MSTAQEIAEWARDGIADFVADNWADRKYTLDEIEKMLRSVEINTSKRFPAVDVGSDPLHANVIKRIWKECRELGLDYVAFAWRIERHVRATQAAPAAASTKESA